MSRSRLPSTNKPNISLDVSSPTSSTDSRNRGFNRQMREIGVYSIIVLKQPEKRKPEPVFVELLPHSEMSYKNDRESVHCVT
jgi:hypothetical protein